MLSDPQTLYKLMILYMLRRVKFPLKNSQISEFFLDKEYTDYISLQQALAELLESHLISAEEIRNSPQYEITREGEEALAYFGSNVSEEIKADLDAFLKENKIRLRNEVGVIADYFRNSNGEIQARCEVREGKSPLISLQLAVPSEKTAELICENWKLKNQKIYSFLMQELMGVSEE